MIQFSRLQTRERLPCPMNDYVLATAHYHAHGSNLACPNGRKSGLPFGTMRAAAKPLARESWVKERVMTVQEAKKRLLTKAKDLTHKSEAKDEIAIEQDADMMDAIQRTADRELALDSLSRNWKSAALVSQALQRIEKGMFGICTECEEPIAEKRLKALPWARYCITCQERCDRAGEPIEDDLASVASA
jgi:DnaK suppressor protein